MEKCLNKKSIGYLFQDFDECQFYQAQYGGVIHAIQKIEDVSEVLERSPLGLDDDCDMVGSIVSYKFVQTGSPYYVLVLKAEKRLRNGFRFIKEMVLQEHNFKLMKAYDSLASAGVKMFSVKTDCFTIPAECETKARDVLAFDNGIGSWRVSKTDDIIFPFTMLQHEELTAIEFNHLITKELTIDDEWDVNELCDHFVENRRVMLRAEFAGSGKSFACKAMEERGYKVLFVCPTNKLALNNLENGCTLNAFFSVGMTDDATSRMSKFDDSKYDVIVFDEIFFANVQMMAKITL